MSHRLAAVASRWGPRAGRGTGFVVPFFVSEGFPAGYMVYLGRP
jgi:hypothetical protein